MSRPRLVLTYFEKTSANNIPNTYSAALSIQALGRPFAMIPRFFWVVLVFVIYTVAGVAGREHFSVILSNFLSVLGYWTSFFIVIVVEEHFIFRRKGGRLGGYNLADWDNPSKCVSRRYRQRRANVSFFVVSPRCRLRVCVIPSFPLQIADRYCGPLGSFLRNSGRGGRYVASVVHRPDREDGRCDVRR